MSKAEKTRQFIIETTAPLFNKKGYENTSLSDVQEATKLTKGAIYGNFSDKNELAVAAFEYNCLVSFTRVKSLMDAQSAARDALKAYGNFYADNWVRLSERGGCSMQNAAVEADDHLDFLKAGVRKSMKRVMKNLQQVIEKGQANKEFKKNISAPEYAALIFSVIEGNILLSKTMNDVKYLRLAADRISFIVDNELTV